MVATACDFIVHPAAISGVVIFVGATDAILNVFITLREMHIMEFNKVDDQT
jgi:hypothetical protein